jgi:L-alanine-DL-glutamate epimerase-like enolase superfamily enzyme
MKITSLHTMALSRMHEPERQWITSTYRTVKADCAIVVIETDSGIKGIGEASAYGGPLKIRDWIDWLGPEIVGTDPEDPSIAPSPNGDRGAYDAAVAGIDCALWDLRGRIAGKPTASLLTAAPAKRIRLYASAGCSYDWRARPEQLIDEAERWIEEGFTAMKFRIGTNWSWDGITVDRFLGLVRDIARTVEGRIELAVDGNCRLTEGDALTVARELDRLGFLWFEEPVPWKDPDMYARLNAAVDLPITGGESFTTVEQFRPFLDRKAYAIVQPDAGLAGITESVRIGAAAYRRGAKLIPHSWHNGLMAMANAHLVASLPEPLFLEICKIQGPLQWGIIKDPPIIENGYLVLPDRPGLGVDLADNLEQTFPYIEGHYGVVVDRVPGAIA